MSWALEFSPLIDWRVIAALAALAGIVCLAGLTLRLPGAWLRLAAAALFVLALLDPSIRQEDREALPGIVAVVTDHSPSQKLGGREQQTENALGELLSRLERLRNLEVRTIEAGRGGSEGTELFGALEQGLGDVPAERVAGVVLITDGQVHDIPGDARQLGFNAPVHTLLTGREGERDRRLVLRSAPRFGIVGERQPITFRVEDMGTPANGRLADTGRVGINVRRDGETVERMEVTRGIDTTAHVTIARGGRNIVEIEAEEAEDELTLLNNRAVVTVEGIRDNLRVLLISGEPHAGERTWRNILKSDASVDLVHFTILRPPEKQDGTPISQLSLIAFPTRELFAVKIDEFDLIIFDRYRSRGVLPAIYYDNIARYVQGGGAVLVAAGPELAGPGSVYRTPLSVILPAEPIGSVTEEPYRAARSGDGARHPITRELDEGTPQAPGWSRWFRLVDATARSGATLMTGPEERPLLVVDRAGEGRVAMLMSDHAWLWARGYEGGGPYVPLLRRLAHWLMQESDLDEEALTARHEGGRLVVERRTMAADTPPARIEMPSGGEQELVMAETGPGHWQGTVETDEPGIYRIAQGDLLTLINVGPDNPREFADARSTAEHLAPLAAQTGGGVFRIGAAESPAVPRVLPVRGTGTLHGSDWMGLRQTDASRLRGVRSLPLFAGLIGLAILLGILSITWYREGR